MQQFKSIIAYSDSSGSKLIYSFSLVISSNVLEEYDFSINKIVFQSFFKSYVAILGSEPLSRELQNHKLDETPG